MWTLRRFLLFLLLLVILAAGLFFSLQTKTKAEFGSAVALCPGPDLYGYTCEDGPVYAYIDATTDTLLYTDDDVVTIPLPFPFTFYGTVYTEIQASTNGNIQFSSNAPYFINTCLDDGPATQMGDMIAPFWDDLDLTLFGSLEYDVVGTAPNRIFVLEWDDVPRYGDLEERLTFAVQLFESNQDIVFLYADTTVIGEGLYGNSATIGIQSEAQGLALQLGCNQSLVNDTRQVRIKHPDLPNADIGLDAITDSSFFLSNTLFAKGETAELINQLNLYGPVALPSMNFRWLNQSPPSRAFWEWLDLTGDGQEELLLIQTSPKSHSENNALIILSLTAEGQYTLWEYLSLYQRDNPIQNLEVLAKTDLTGDGKVDAVLHDSYVGQTIIVTADKYSTKTVLLPDRCRGDLRVSDQNQDGQPEIIRDACLGNNHIGTQWQETKFINLP